MKISVISFDLAHNCLGRSYILAKVLQRRYDVEIHGSFFPRHGDRVWPPCATDEFQYHSVKGCDFPDYFSSVRDMLRNVTGDVIYASKLRMPSFGIALLKKLSSFKPVVLDIDDLETSWATESDWQAPMKNLLADPIGPLHTKIMERLSWAANDITTVSSKLQQKFGGVIIPHGKDTDFLDPALYDRAKLRSHHGLDQSKVIMFLGTPRPHKGLEDILHALKMLKDDRIKLVIIGKGSDLRYEARLQELGGDAVVLMDMIPFKDVPKYLAMADLVAIPQRQLLQAEGQIPAKVFDAMAMAKPILATRVSDLPSILDGCGMIVEPEDHHDMAEKIAWTFENPAEAAEMGSRARERCIRDFSWNVMEERLANVFEKYRKQP